MIAATIRFVSSLALTVSAPAMPTQSPAAPPPAAARAPGVPGLVAPDATPKVLVEGLKFAEGPAADAAGNVMFCDLATSEVFRLVQDVGAWRNVRATEATGGMSGLVFMPGGSLLGCQMRTGSLVELVPAGGDARTIEPRSLTGADARAGLNDLTVDARGRIWITNMGDRRHPEWTGLWRFDPAVPASAAVQFRTGASRPNGVRFSPHAGGRLWVTDYLRPRAFIVAIPEGEPSPGLEGRGTEVSLEPLATGPRRGGADGLAVDAKGNAWIALPGHDRVAVVGPDGAPLGWIEVPDGPSNCCFGGADGRTLFITTRSSVRALPTLVEGWWAARADRQAQPAPKAP
jgi:gluconolactonase